MAEFTYKKLGEGTLRLRNGRRIKPNEVFTADEADIPKAFAKAIVKWDGVPKQAVRQRVSEKQVKQEVPKRSNVPKQEEAAKQAAIYTLVERDVEGWFDVVNQEGKPINDKGLRKHKAEAMIEELTSKEKE